MNSKKIIVLTLISVVFFACNRKKEEVENLTKLEQLMLRSTNSIIDYYNLSNDSITVLPNLSAYTIKSLDISYNLLDSIDMTHLPKGLETLNASHNRLTVCPDISKTEIKTVNFSHNHIASFGNWGSHKIKSLKSTLDNFDLSHNNLSVISFCNIDSLEYIRRVKSSKKKISPKSVLKLNLSWNSITDFVGRIDANLLDLSNNKLSSVELSLSIVDSLNISENSNMPNEIRYIFDKPQINTIIRNNISNNSPIIFYSTMTPIPTICNAILREDTMAIKKQDSDHK